MSIVEHDLLTKKRKELILLIPYFLALKILDEKIYYYELKSEKYVKFILEAFFLQK